MPIRRHLVAAALLILLDNARAGDTGSVVIRASTKLHFTRLSAGDVAADFGLSFKNTTGRTLCVREGMLPGTPDFDPGLIKFTGPRGELPVIDSAAASQRHFLPIDPMVTRMIVIFRDNKYDWGIRISKDDYDFSQPGHYVAELRVPVGDCSALGLITSINDDNPKWFIGHIVAEAQAEVE